jgi:hypothetical protein
MGTRYLASQDEVLPLSPDSTLWVDVDAFEEAAKAARRSGAPALRNVSPSVTFGLPIRAKSGWVTPT